jgi:D-alanyl-D-alanine carboxypeptidase (penicillin-binding protein 5/6)
MTALLSLEHLNLRQRLSATPYQPGAAESVIGLRPGERMAVKDLLRALLLPSANDAAVTLANGVAGSIRRFVRQMNRRAAQLGLAETHYANPIGLDEAGNFSSALDLSQLARRLLRNKTFASIVKLPQARLRTGARPRIIANRNDLVARVPWIDGVKTGHTLGAGYVLIGYGRQSGVRLVSVVLGEPSETRRDTDTLALLEHGFSLYRHVRVASPNQGFAKAHVRFYGDRTVNLVTPGRISVAVRPDERLKTQIDAPKSLEGPLERGTRVGTLTVFSDGERVRVRPLVTAESVPAAGFFRKAASHLGIVLAIGLGVVLAAVVVRRRGRRQKTGTRRHRVVT